MAWQIRRTFMLAAATFGPLLVPVAAIAQIAVSANDGKAVLVDGVSKIPAEPERPTP